MPDHTSTSRPLQVIDRYRRVFTITEHREPEIQRNGCTITWLRYTFCGLPVETINRCRFFLNGNAEIEWWRHYPS